MTTNTDVKIAPPEPDLLPEDLIRRARELRPYLLEEQAATEEQRLSAARLREIEERLRPSKDQVDRQAIRSPVDGIVMGLRVSAAGEVLAAGAPIEAVGLLVASLVLLPETVAALGAARRNELQKSLNLALGSSLATIGLTIPAVSILALVLNAPLELGVDMHDTVLLVLTFAVSIVTFDGGRTNILPGFVHLALFAIFVFLVFVP